MKTKSLGFIGGGRITNIFLQGFSNKNVLPENVKVFEPNAETLRALQEKFPQVTAAASPADAATQEIVFLAVHPPMMMETLQAIKDAVKGEAVVISLAPKITLEKMAAVLSAKNLARMIPNATSFINEGYNPVTFSSGFDTTEKKQVLKLLKKLGKTFEIEEAKLEAYAMASAMLPTYFWFQWQAMEKVSQEMELTLEEAQKAVSSTLKKAWKLYYKSGLTPEEVIDLIPVKPIGDAEEQIREIYQSKLIGLYHKIKP